VKGEARYGGAEWVAGPSGVSLLVGALASADCAVEEVIERHSHALIIGEPLSFSANPVDDALIFWRSRYASSRAVDKVAAE
jgi:flavin reductase (DIM6/NTAB) family NADH-FMN oxidoreductase RutF